MEIAAAANLLAAPALSVPLKRMMGPGPSNSPQRVLDSLALPILGHMHPETFRLMDECKAGAQYALQTRNPCTLCVSASGHGAVEAAMCNLIEAGDVVLMVVTGVWGQRAGEMARRYGADVRYVRTEGMERAAAGGGRTAVGETVALRAIEERMAEVRPVLVFVTQGDSSTGVLQPVEGLGELCRRYNSLLVVDTVASLGGVAFHTDRWLVDCAYTGGQKVLGAPAGLTPITFGERALQKVRNRRTTCPVYYFDILLLGEYWACFEGKPRIYHHTIAATLLYGLREALVLFCREGIQPSAYRHKMCAARLHSGLHTMGLQLFVERPVERLPTVTTVRVPHGVDWKRVVDYAMEHHKVEISGGLGPSAGQVFRIGLMGENATMDRVDLVLRVLREALEKTSAFRVKQVSKL